MKRKILPLLLACIFIICCVAPVHAANKDVEEIMSQIVFLGDSTTAHLSARGGIPRERIWTGSGSTLLFTSVLAPSLLIKGEKLTASEAAGKYRPHILIITIGASGGAGFVNEEQFKQIYKRLICDVKSASPQTKIIVQSILPLSEKSVNHYKKLTKDAVSAANGWIKELASELGIPYINTHDLLIDESGYLRAKYQSDEYLHLTSDAYAVILKAVREFILSNIDNY